MWYLQLLQAASEDSPASSIWVLLLRLKTFLLLQGLLHKECQVQREALEGIPLTEG